MVRSHMEPHSPAKWARAGGSACWLRQIASPTPSSAGQWGICHVQTQEEKRHFVYSGDPPSALVSAEKLAQARNSSQVYLVTIPSRADRSLEGILATLVGHRAGVQSYADSMWLEKSKRCRGVGAVVCMDGAGPLASTARVKRLKKTHPGL